MTQHLSNHSNDSISNWVQQWGRRWSQIVTLVILVNVGLVLFNMTYVSLRPLYLQYWPALVNRYDPVKGIEPHPMTEHYLATIKELRSHLTADNPHSSIQPVMADLRQQSAVLIQENPFLGSNQVASFARLKRRLQRFTGTSSAQAAFDQLWQTDRLEPYVWTQTDAFLTAKVEPLLRRNYFRAATPTGQYVDEFWRIDLGFILFFGAELLLRTLMVSRTQQGVSWGDAIARRWYELPLVLPYFRGLRLIPAAIRLHRTQLFDSEALIRQITHEPAAYLSDRIAKYMMVRLISQAQTSVRAGTLLAALTRKDTYATVGDPQKVDQIIDHLSTLIALRVMPKVRPDLEALLGHSLRRALSNNQIYEGLSQVPALSILPKGALANVSDYLAEATCDVLAESYGDREGKALLDRFGHNIKDAIGTELQAHANSEELQILVSDLLEELKINYIQDSQNHNPKETMQEVDQLHQFSRTV